MLDMVPFISKENKAEINCNEGIIDRLVERAEM